MEVSYYITSEFEKYKKYAEEGIMELIELKFLNISKEEEQILKNLNINYKIYRNKTIKIQLLNFINYVVEKDGEEKGIYIKKTKEYEKAYFNVDALCTDDIVCTEVWSLRFTGSSPISSRGYSCSE